jgi:hypothetical protein
MYGGVVDTDAFLREKIFHARQSDAKSFQWQQAKELLDFNKEQRSSLEVFCLQEILQEYMLQERIERLNGSILQETT